MPALPARGLSGGSGARGFSAHSGPLHSTAVHLAASPDQCSTYAQLLPAPGDIAPERPPITSPPPPPQGGPSLPHLCWCPTGHSIFLQTLPFQGSPTVLRAGTLDNFGDVFSKGHSMLILWVWTFQLQISQAPQIQNISPFIPFHLGGH